MSDRRRGSMSTNQRLQTILDESIKERMAGNGCDDKASAKRRRQRAQQRGRLYGIGSGGSLPATCRAPRPSSRSSLMGSPDGLSLSSPGPGSRPGSSLRTWTSPGRSRGGGGGGGGGGGDGRKANRHEHDSMYLCSLNSFDSRNPDRFGIFHSTNSTDGCTNEKLPWYLGYNNTPHMPSGSPFASAARYGFRGANAMVEWERPSCCSPNKSYTANTPEFLRGQSDSTNEWTPKLVAAPSSAGGPSLCSPGLWPDNAEYVSGFKGKKQSQSSWYDRETTVTRPRTVAGDRLQRTLDREDEDTATLARSVRRERKAIRRESILGPLGSSVTRAITAGGHGPFSRGGLVEGDSIWSTLDGGSINIENEDFLGGDENDFIRVPDPVPAAEGRRVYTGLPDNLRSDPRPPSIDTVRKNVRAVNSASSAFTPTHALGASSAKPVASSPERILPTAMMASSISVVSSLTGGGSFVQQKGRLSAAAQRQAAIKKKARSRKPGTIKYWGSNAVVINAEAPARGVSGALDSVSERESVIRYEVRWRETVKLHRVLKSMSSRIEQLRNAAKLAAANASSSSQKEEGVLNGRGSRPGSRPGSRRPSMNDDPPAKTADKNARKSSSCVFDNYIGRRADSETEKAPEMTALDELTELMKLAAAVNPGTPNILTREQFVEVIIQRYKEHFTHREANLLYSGFDPTRTGRLNFVELIGTLRVLCCAEEPIEEKLYALFNLFQQHPSPTKTTMEFINTIFTLCACNADETEKIDRLFNEQFKPTFFKISVRNAIDTSADEWVQGKREPDPEEILAHEFADFALALSECPGLVDEFSMHLQNRYDKLKMNTLPKRNRILPATVKNMLTQTFEKTFKYTVQEIRVEEERRRATKSLNKKGLMP